MRCRGIEFGRVYGRLRLILVIFLVANPVRPLGWRNRRRRALPLRCSSRRKGCLTLAARCTSCAVQLAWIVNEAARAVPSIVACISYSVLDTLVIVGFSAVILRNRSIADTLGFDDILHD